MSELKKCPFCGKSDIHIEQKGTFFWCECYDCGAISREHHTLPGVNVLQSEDIARGYWNQRPLEDALHARIAELEAENERLKEELQYEKTRSQLNLEAEERRMLNITYYCAEIDRLNARIAELEAKNNRLVELAEGLADMVDWSGCDCDKPFILTEWEEFIAEVQE